MAQQDDKPKSAPLDPEDDGQAHNSTSRYGHPYDGPLPSRTRRPNINIHDPMLLWLFVLTVAVVLRILATSTTLLPAGSQLTTLINDISSFLLQFPGIIIMPLIIGVVIGSKVGERSNSLASTLKTGLINGIYASIIYLIGIVIIYIVLSYFTPAFSTTYLTVLNSIALPIVIFLLTLEIIAVLSYSRRADS